MPEQKAKPRVAILGCGYVGLAVADALVQAGHEVVGTTTTPERLAELQRKGVIGRLLRVSQTERLHECLADCERVLLSVAPSSPRRDYREVYLKGAQYVLQAVEGTPVHRMIYTSSTRVYGQDDGQWVDESSPTEPVDDDGRILLKAEQTLLGGATVANRRKLAVTVLRLSGIHRPGRDVAGHLGRFAGQSRSDGDKFVNMVHRDDVVAAIVALFNTNHHGVLNLSDDHPTTRREYYDRLLREAYLSPVQWTNPSTPSRGKRISNLRIKALLGLRLQQPSH